MSSGRLATRILGLRAATARILRVVVGCGSRYVVTIRITPSINYRPDIDGLRAIAIVLVVFFHGFPNIVAGGFIGVDVFFVISGFLISSVIFHGLERESFSFARFYAHRICRLFPALITVLAFCLIFGWFVLLPNEYKSLGDHTAGGAVYISNFLLWSEAGYFDVAAEFKPLLHLWSLAIEEQFYIVWPLALAFAYRVRSGMAVLIVFGLLGSFAVNILFVRAYPVATYFLPGTRIWELLIGALLAYSARSSSEPNIIINNLFAAAGLAAIIVSAAILTRISTFPGWWALLPTIGTALMISSPSSWINRTILSHPAIVFVGLIGYPLYLWHWSLFSFVRIIEGETPTESIQAAAIVASVVLAAATYKFIETSLRSNRIALMLTAACLAIGATGYMAATGIIKPYSSRLGVDKIVEAIGEWGFPTPDMEYIQSDGRTILRKVAGKGSVMFLGDSNAQQYWPRAQKILTEMPEKSKTVYLITGGSCPPIPAIIAPPRTPYCNGIVAAALAYIEKQNIDTVVLAAQWWWYFNSAPDQFFVGNQPMTNPLAANEAVQSLSDMIRNLVNAGRKVYLVLNIPVGEAFDPKNLIKRSFMSINVSSGGLSLSEIERRYGDTTHRLRAAGSDAGATIIDPIQFLCSETKDYCPATTDDGTPIYKDNTHLRPKFVRSSILYLDDVLRN